jgi:hypothetical protein
MKLLATTLESFNLGEYLGRKGSDDDAVAIRQCTHTGRPLGTPEFIKALEKPCSGSWLR